MQERFLLVSGKTLIDLVKQLNSDDIEYGRVVYMEKSKDGYHAVLDTWALVVATLEDIRNDEEQIREHNREWLQNLDMDNTATI